MTGKQLRGSGTGSITHLIRPMGIVGQAPQTIWERGEGSRLWDTDGKQYIDMGSGAHCMNLGWSRKEIGDAVREQMQKLSFMVSIENMGNMPAIEFAAELAEVLPGDIKHVFFTVTGTESNEVAIQMAKSYHQVRGEKERYKIICLTHAWHGTSALTASLSGSYGVSMVGGEREYPGIVRVPNYHCYHCAFGLKYPSCDNLCARYLEQVIEQQGEETIAAFIAEPIQGVAGVVWPADEYWRIVRSILSDHNIIMITDCAQTGFCRTGKFWGVDNWNVTPDILTMAKGINSGYLPLGAVGISEKVYDTLRGRIFGGVVTQDASPILVASGRAALRIYLEEKIADRADRLGKHIHERLVTEFLPLPCVDDVMGKGCYQSFEIALNKTTGHKVGPEEQKKVASRVISQIREKGILPRIKHDRRLTIGPPLVISNDELDNALDIILRVMKEVEPV